MKTWSAFFLAALCWSATPALASVERLDLGTLLARADGAVVGTITAKRVVRIDHHKDGPELYYTILTVEGRALVDDAPVAIQVLFAGGFVDARHGVWNSEAPAADEVALGQRVLAFYKFSANVGGDLGGNALYAAHGGLYRIFEARRGAIVQGRGEGYAVDANSTLADLRARARVLVDEAKRRADGAHK